MRLACRPFLAGHLPLVELEAEEDGEVIALTVTLEELATLLAAGRVAMRQALALHQIHCDRPGPLLLIAAEGAA